MNRSRISLIALASASLIALAAGAAADPLRQQEVVEDRYQVYIGETGAASAATASGYSTSGQWGTINLDKNARSGSSFGDGSEVKYSGPAGVSYFTPKLSGMRVGIGISALPRKSSDYTSLGPRTQTKRDLSSNWQAGATLGYSALEIGANIGDHTDPTCKAGGNCKSSDFWDVGVALRFGSGSISAAYTASQARTARPDETARVDVFSLNAGYQFAPGLNIYGGVDWVDFNSDSETADTPLDTRFMLGTSLRF
jgi:predicted porin